MKKTLTMATFLAVGAGAVGVSALDNIPLKGSDTLFNFTNAVLAACPGATGLTYLGTGSGNGENALISGAQTVAPMSRTLGANACAAPAAASAEGIAFGLDAIGIWGSTRALACDQGIGCTAGQETGISFAKTLPSGACTIVDSQDALRLLYFGLSGNEAASPTNRNCNDPCRVELVSNWSNVFRNSCAAPASGAVTGGTACDPDGAGPLAAPLKHAFRRDEASGTTAAFRDFIRAAGATQFCNVADGGDATAGGDTPVVPPRSLPLAPAPYLELYQDFDPIRRAAVGTGNLNIINPNTPPGNVPTEQVASLDGTLGLVLPISIPTLPAGGTLEGDIHPGNFCAFGRFVFGQAARVQLVPSRWALCPNGDMPFGATWNATLQVAEGGAGTCLVPATASGDPRCINGRNNTATIANPPPNPPIGPGLVPAAQRDGRAYNLFLYRANGQLQTQFYNNLNRVVVGAYYRIHRSRTILEAPSNCTDGSCCTFADATDQIKCLVQANPCSIGFAGVGDIGGIDAAAPAGIQDAFALPVNGIPIECTNYSFIRNVYINSLIGFQAVTGDELGLASCFVGQGLAGGATLDGLLLSQSIDPRVGGPCCRDACGGPDGCADNPAPFNLPACPAPPPP